MAGRHSAGSIGLPLLLTLAIALLLTLRIASVWSELPETVASHFGLSGRPDAFMSKEKFFLVMALVGGGSVAALFAAPALLHRLPRGLINLPNRDYWMADEERRAIAVRRWGDYLGWMGVATAAILAVAVELAVQANLHRANFANGTFMIFIAAYFGVAILLVIRMRRAFRVPPSETNAISGR